MESMKWRFDQTGNRKTEKSRKKHKAEKRILTFVLALILAMGALCGCGDGGASQTDGTETAAADGAGAADAQAGGGNSETQDAAENEQTAMGRYVETAVDISEICGRARGITVLSDGRFLIPEEKTGQLISSDGGETWEALPIPGIDDMAAFVEDYYIFDMAAAPDGTVAVLYVESGDYERTGTFHPFLHVAKPDGTVQTLEALPVSADEMYVKNIFYSEEGELFAIVVGSGNVYRVDVESGTLTKVVTMEWRPDLIKFQGDQMFFLTSREGVSIYDRREEKWIEDPVLSDFMAENYQSEYYADDSFSVYMAPGEDGVLYIAGKGGLYRHVIGGSAIEQIIDGALTSFSNPSMSILGVAAYGEHEFAALFTGGRVALYHYDPDVPTVPENMISVYSLKEQDVVRQAIAQFQTENPDMYVRYEVGLSGTDAKAADDAIKKLNTELMAGKGPDVIIMDGLPASSYEEKGILRDLKPHIDSLSGDAALLPNIVEAFTREGGVYMMPVSLTLPMVSGRQDDLAGITDYASLADTVEKIRAREPEAEIGRFFSEEAMMRWFLSVAAPAFLEASGGIDEQALTEYLTLTKRIYAASQEGLADETKESYGWQKDYYKQDDWAYENFNSISQQADDFLLYDLELAAGMVKGVYGYQEMLSMKYCEGLGDVAMQPFDGMSSGVFEPAVLVGLSAASAHPEDAERFFDIIMGYEVQTLIYDGFMVNQAALTNQLSPQWKIFQNAGMDVDYGEVSSSMGGSMGDGREFHIDIYMPTKEEFDALYDLCCQVKTPYLKDTVVENALIEIGAQFLEGYLSEAEAVDKIMARVAIYMAE
ncbi:MAG: ABC transporter substrate-binding protein [Bacteroidales bacterium]|nr:ABC transporter substrate-binding protein [Bacteroidales bacterium]MCM1416024.1 ABC transporter substrate-binding protein [bacterium]MCM1423835.1 ABC transporter substrate-binding protein [bacterium]